MTLHQLHLVGFAAGSVVHGVQAALVANRWRQTSGVDRRRARYGLFVCGLAFFWQFGNFVREFSQTIGFREATLPFEAGNFMRAATLTLFPLLFSYMIGRPVQAGRVAAGFSAWHAPCVILCGSGLRTLCCLSRATRPSSLD